MFIYQKLAPEQRLFRMTALKKGFTLIELLVVVLIIGILAAIALPQYEFSVKKARAAQGLIYVRAVRDAQERYYMANGSYTTDLEQLDLQVSAPADYTSFVSSSMVSLKYKTEPWAIRAAFQFRTQDPELNGKVYCWAAFDNEEADRFCHRYTGKGVFYGNYTGNTYEIE